MRISDWSSDVCSSDLLVHPKFGSCSKTVFDGTKDAIGMMPVSFELKDGIHHVFQDLRAGNQAVLGDMADHEYGNVALFCEAKQFRSTFPDLGDATGGRINVCRVKGLN